MDLLSFIGEEGVLQGVNNSDSLQGVHLDHFFQEINAARGKVRIGPACLVELGESGLI